MPCVEIQKSVLRLSILACLTVASLAVSSVASAECTELQHLLWSRGAARVTREQQQRIRSVGAWK